MELIVVYGVLGLMAVLLLLWFTIRLCCCPTSRKKEGKDNTLSDMNYVSISIEKDSRMEHQAYDGSIRGPLHSTTMNFYQEGGCKADDVSIEGDDNTLTNMDDVSISIEKYSRMEHQAYDGSIRGPLHSTTMDFYQEGGCCCTLDFYQEGGCCCTSSNGIENETLMEHQADDVSIEGEDNTLTNMDDVSISIENDSRREHKAYDGSIEDNYDTLTNMDYVSISIENDSRMEHETDDASMEDNYDTLSDMDYVSTVIWNATV